MKLSNCPICGAEVDVHVYYNDKATEESQRAGISVRCGSNKNCFSFNSAYIPTEEGFDWLIEAIKDWDDFCASVKRQKEKLDAVEKAEILEKEQWKIEKILNHLKKAQMVCPCGSELEVVYKVDIDVKRAGYNKMLLHTKCNRPDCISNNFENAQNYENTIYLDIAFDHDNLCDFADYLVNKHCERYHYNKYKTKERKGEAE